MSVVLAGKWGRFAAPPPLIAPVMHVSVFSAVACLCCSVSVIDAGRTYAHAYAYAYAYTYVGQYKCTYIYMHTKLSRV
jgi:hypothetical protein